MLFRYSLPGLIVWEMRLRARPLHIECARLRGAQNLMG